MSLVASAAAAPSQTVKPSAADAARLLVSDGILNKNVMIKMTPRAIKVKLAIPAASTQEAGTIRKRKAHLLTSKRSLGGEISP
jgi:hypothetical protein